MPLVHLMGSLPSCPSIDPLVPVMVAVKLTRGAPQKPGLPLPVRVVVGVGTVVALPLTVAVPLRLGVVLRLGLLLAPKLALAVALGDDVSDGGSDREPVILALALGGRDPLGLTDGAAPAVRLDVGVTDG